jgi:hypothetical protein
MNTGGMAYVVIVCSRCRLARGAPETAKTATCPGCGRKLRVQELKKYHRAESLSETAEAIGQLNAKLKGGLDAYLGDLNESIASGRKREKMEKAPGDGAAAPAAQEKPSVPAAKVDRAILSLLGRRGPQTPDMIHEALPIKTSLDHVEKRLEAMRRLGLLYEPSAGKYAIVP